MLALTGTPLLALSIVATIGAAAFTMLCWRRGGRVRVLTRTGCVLLCEALALFTAGLLVNDSFDDLYPSWSALFQPDAAPSPSTIAAGPDTSMELWLRGHVGDADKKGLVFDWKPRELASWHLAATPTVYVPPAYFTQTDLRFPVVVLVAPGKAGPNQSGWDSATLAALVAESSADPVPAILVFLRVDRPDTGRLLDHDLPARLDADVRVNGRGWGVVGVGTDAGEALTALAGDPDRYRSAVVVAGGDGVLAAPLVTRAHQARTDQVVLLVPGPPAGATAGGTGGQGGGGPVVDGTADAATVQPVAQPGQRVVVALRWLYQQLSPPLAAPVPGPVGSVPPPPGHR